ncbi:leucine-rich repeat-containing protein 37B-like [Hypanus sabinus]|uniref:leucine-rich repeat-containing protein 37B-like n=1 Tax=Hypanus sabinus TaxID=79690 RepID=UPI0028C431EF|nr:leucine-rich repeat-containing protein 37B-like [Hypanus sabinus]
MVNFTTTFNVPTQILIKCSRDFSENAITTVQKNNWLPYRWAENLDLHGNQLEKLQKDSFEGLILLKKLILSGNVISKIAGFTFQALPFLENLDLSDNKLTALLDGTFKSWHGLRFFRKLNLNSNPLELIENDAFDKLPSLQYLDLSGTKLSVQTMYPAFMAVPNIVQLDLPDGVRCCLCYVARTVEILFKTVKFDCPNRCASDTSCVFYTIRSSTYLGIIRKFTSPSIYILIWITLQTADAPAQVPAKLC